MSPRRWRDGVAAASDVERDEAQTPARGMNAVLCLAFSSTDSLVSSGYGKDRRDSVWSEKVDKAAAGLQKWLAIYSVNVTELKGGKWRSVLQAVTHTKDLTCRLQTRDCSGCHDERGRDRKHRISYPKCVIVF